MDRTKKLSVNDLEFVRAYRKELKNQKVYYNDDKELINKINEIFTEYFKRNWPEIESEILVGKNDEEFNDCIAYNIGKENPELYVWVSENGPSVYDESIFDAYDEGPYKKSRWHQQQ